MRYGAQKSMQPIFGWPEKHLPVQQLVPIRWHAMSQSRPESARRHRGLSPDNRTTVLGVTDGDVSLAVLRYDFSPPRFAHLKKCEQSLGAEQAI